MCEIHVNMLETSSLKMRNNNNNWRSFYTSYFRSDQNRPGQLDPGEQKEQSKNEANTRVKY